MTSTVDIKKIFSKNEIKLETNKSLAPFTTIRVGGEAAYFARAHNSEQLYAIISIIKKYEIPFFVIGKGSNLIISDKGFNGLAVLNEAAAWRKLSEEEIAEKKVLSYNSVARVDDKILDDTRLTYNDDGAPDIFIRVESGARIQPLMKTLFNHQITGLQWFTGIPATIGGAVYMNLHGGPRYFGDIRLEYFARNKRDCPQRGLEFKAR
jgi:UDP-N-acetylmuramate dehydrogenase